MAARSKPQVDCPHCGMNSFLCICGIFPKLLLATRVSVIIPWLEWLRTSNTGRLVELLLENSRVLIRGKKGSPMAPEEPLAAGYANLVLYPGGRPLSRELAASFGSPVNLIVPDGTWESAGRTIVRETVLGELPRVSLPPSAPSKYRLRASPVAERLATLEAVGRALELLEGPHAGTHLEGALRMKVERMLWAKGRLRAEEVSGGIPAEAKSWKAGTSLDSRSSGRVKCWYGNETRSD